MIIFPHFLNRNNVSKIEGVLPEVLTIFKYTPRLSCVKVQGCLEVDAAAIIVVAVLIALIVLVVVMQHSWSLALSLCGL